MSTPVTTPSLKMSLSEIFCILRPPCAPFFNSSSSRSITKRCSVPSPQSAMEGPQYVTNSLVFLPMAVSSVSADVGLLDRGGVARDAGLDGGRPVREVGVALRARHRERLGLATLHEVHRRTEVEQAHVHLAVRRSRGSRRAALIRHVQQLHPCLLREHLGEHMA